MTKKKFSDFTISPEVLKAIQDLGFEHPTHIQAESIPLLLSGQDLIGRAQTGTGKTAAFAIPLFEKLDSDLYTVQGLVLCPTRELVQQVAEEFRRLLKYRKDVQVQTIYGGAHIGDQLKGLKKNPQIVVGTPGRLLDHIRRKSLRLSDIHTLVLDEADEMLDMGFRDDIDLIVSETPEERQTVLFSATMTQDILKLMKKYQRDAVKVDVTDEKRNTPGITQYVYEMRERQKPEALVRLLSLHDVKLAVVFCNTKMAVDSLVQFLKTGGYSADALHGDLTQKMREKVMGTFRAGGIRILVATDIAGRGIDVRNVEAVFNYDLPRDDEDYVHRIGRTGRAGASGLAFTFISSKEHHILRRIERTGEMTIIRRKVPSIAELEAHLRERETSSLAALVTTEGLVRYRKQVEKLAEETGHSVLDIAAALLKQRGGNRVEKFNETEEFEEFVERKEKAFSKGNDRRPGGGKKFGRPGSGGNRKKYGASGGKGKANSGKPGKARSSEKKA